MSFAPSQAAQVEQNQNPKLCKCAKPVLSIKRQWMLRFQGGAYRCYTCNGYRRLRK